MKHRLVYQKPSAEETGPEGPESAEGCSVSCGAQKQPPGAGEQAGEARRGEGEEVTGQGL